MAFSLVTACPACGKQNRIPAPHLTDHGRCGACKATLPPAQEPIEAAESAFDEIIHAAKVPVLVDFWAPWCGPCRAVAPEIRALAQEVAGGALVLKVNSDEAPMLSQRYGIRSIPNLMIFHRGKPVAQRAGAAPKAELKRWLQSAASA
jgi:thioredoxin 2